MTSLAELLHFDRDRVRKLVFRQAQRLLAHELGDLHLDRQVGALLLREVQRPFGQQRDELLAQLLDAVAGLRADRMERMKVAEPRSRLHLRGDVAALQPVDLVQDDHHGNAELEDAPRDEAVARADPLACGQNEHHGIDVLERTVHRALHVLGERVERPLEARQVGEHELVVLPVRDPEDPAPRRLRLVGDDRDLATRERVHEGRLADVRPSGDGDEARLQAGRSQVSGSSSAGE